MEEGKLSLNDSAGKYIPSFAKTTVTSRENMSANDLLVALVVTALTWTIFWFARHSRQRNWLQ